jgi:uncharacterized damage-inducible protein DinB
MDKILEIQMDASVWGVRRVLETCRALTPEQFNMPQGVGPDGGSLQSTLSHVIEAMFYIADNLDGLPYREPPELGREGRTPDGLLGQLEKAERRIRKSLDSALERSGGDLNTNVVWSYSKRNVPLGVAIAQIFDHNTHHRVQCVHMLKKLGVDPLPAAYPLEWQGF